MSKWPEFVAAVVLGAALASCGPSERTALVQSRDSQLKDFKPVSYSRTVDDVEEKITIAADGSMTRARTGPALTGKLSEFQIMQLKRLFDDWDKLNSKYAAPPESDNANVTTITYGQKSVIVSDAAKEIPEPFVLIRRKIEQFSQELVSPLTAEGGTP